MNSRSSWTWATVTAISPLRVKLDGDSAAIAVTPASTGGQIFTVGQRVWCQIYKGRVIVHGGGLDAWDNTAPDPTSIDSRFALVNPPNASRRMGMCAFNVDLAPNVTIAAGDITNINLFTLPAGFRPVRGAQGNISNIGASITINASGVFTLDSLERAWGAGENRNLRAHYFLA